MLTACRTKQAVQKGSEEAFRSGSQAARCRRRPMSTRDSTSRRRHHRGTGNPVTPSFKDTGGSSTSRQHRSRVSRSTEKKKTQGAETLEKDPASATQLL
nr:uncharacterized protein LOC126531680 isoform X1 [Dermacentor andersoni]